MDSAIVLPELLKLIGWLIILLSGIVAWIGQRIHDRLDAINHTLGKIDKDLSGQVASLDKRVTVIEHHAGVNERADLC